MRELRAALVVEGPSDAWFLPRVLTRALDAICRSESVDVEVREVGVLPIRRGGGLVEGVCVAAGECLDDLFFYHYDGGANSVKAERQYWEPLAAAWRQVPGGRELVPVVPVREMEAWALADPVALRNVIGVAWSKRDVFWGDRPGDVEKLDDPKGKLQKISDGGRSGRRRARHPEEYLPLLAAEVSLEVLRDVPSFRQWSTDTVEALRKMRFLPW